MSQTIHCDISDMDHSGEIKEIHIDVIFDHDQEDGQSKTHPYFQKSKLDICEGCKSYILQNRRYIYGYGAMGYNKYYIYIK